MDEFNLEDKVMLEIKSGRVKLRSRYIFLAETLGLHSALVLTLLLAALFACLTVFYLQTSDNLEYLSFGNQGFFAFLESFPFLLLAALILLIFAAGIIIKQSNWAYKKSFGYVSVGLVVFVVVGGVCISYTPMSEQIEDMSYRPHFFGKMLKPFFPHESQEKQRGVAGRVVTSSPGFVFIQTPRGSVKIDLSKLADSGIVLKEGGFLMAIGQRQDGVFVAQGLRNVEEGRMPIIRRGVHHCFGQDVHAIPFHIPPQAMSLPAPIPCPMMK